MKIFFFLLLCPMIAWAQNVSLDSLLTPQQMKEDADYYFSTLLYNHPNPYYYYSKKEFEDKEKSIYDRLNEPMTCRKFIWTIAEINGYVDAHSSISLVTTNPVWLNDFIDLEKSRFFPNVNLKNEKIYLKEIEIEEINGIKTTDLLKDLKQYYNWKLPHERNWILLQNGFSFFLSNKYEMKAPFKVKFAHSDKIQILQGIPAREYYENSSLDIHLRGGNFAPYRIYPFSNIAIFSIYTFTEREQEYMQKELDNFFLAVKNANIKHIFYDLTLNRGGEFYSLWNLGMKSLDIIKHDDIYFRLNETKRTEQGISKYQTNKMVLSSNMDTDVPDNRKLYILQGTNTQSCGDYYCRVIAENKLGTLVGQNTGEPTTAFTDTKFYYMPHSKWPVLAANSLFDFSEYFKEETLHPDLYWDVNHNREFTEEELVRIVEQCKTIRE